MKIPLNMQQDGSTSTRQAQDKVLEHEIVEAKRGDWTAKNNLARTFLPLITSLAEKRAQDPAQINDFIEAGKEGLFRAARKYKANTGPEKFQIEAVAFIESAMDKSGGKGGFLSRLFGGS